MAIALLAHGTSEECIATIAEFPLPRVAPERKWLMRFSKLPASMMYPFTNMEFSLGDHYDPLRKRLVFSTANYHGTSLAAVGIAAHECGHAIQHQQAYGPLHLRMAAVGITSFASQIALWLPLFGMFTGLIALHTSLVMLAVTWGVMMAFDLHLCTFCGISFRCSSGAIATMIQFRGSPWKRPGR